MLPLLSPFPCFILKFFSDIIYLVSINSVFVPCQIYFSDIKIYIFMVLSLFLYLFYFFNLI